MDFKPIYSDRTDLLEYLLQNDILEKFESEMDNKWRISIGEQPKPEAGKAEPMMGLGQSPTVPWIYINPDPNRNCSVNTSLFYKCGIIPKLCFYNCWKVIIKPRSVRELFLLHDLMEYMKDEYTDCWCKCGIEERNYVESAYGGYFYNNSLKEGVVRCQEVMKEVGEHISKETGDAVYLKKGCTEMELKFGNSKDWKWHESFERWERIYREHFVTFNDAHLQPKFVREHVMLTWLKHATDKGDPMAMYYNEGKPLYPVMHKYYQRRTGGKP